LAEANVSVATSRDGLVRVVAGGILSGIATPLMVPLIDEFNGIPGDIRLALLALPFAILVVFVVRRFSSNPRWAAFAAAVISMFAFVCAVNAAVWVDGQAGASDKVARNILSGLAGGFAGTTVMALGIRMLPAGPRAANLWVPMVITGTVVGALLAVDNALNLDLISVLFPVWQVAVGVALANVMRHLNAD
jgi:hypothetical protein